MTRALALVAAFSIWSGGRTALATEESQSSLTPHTLKVNSAVGDVSLSPDGRRIAVVVDKVSPKGSEDKKITVEIQIWEWASDTLVLHKSLFEQPYVKAAARPRPGFIRYNEAGDKLVVFQRDGRLLAVNAATLDIVHEIETGKHAMDMAIDSRGLRAAVLSKDEVSAYDLSSGRLLRTWPVPTQIRTGSISVSPSGDELVLGFESFVPGERKFRSGEQNVFVYQMDSGQQLTAISAGYLVGTVRLTPDHTLVTVSGDDTRNRNNRHPMKIWDARSGKLLREIQNPDEGIHHVLEVSEDGRIAAAGIGLTVSKPAFLWLEGVTIHKNDRLRFWNLATGDVLATTPALSSEFAGSARLSRDGRVAAAFAVNSGSILLFEVPVAPSKTGLTH